MEQSVQTGDILLFDRDCNVMNPLGRFLCRFAKCGCRYDHIALAVESPASNDTTTRKTDFKESENNGDAKSPLVIEANFHGVTDRSLENRMQRKYLKRIVSRTLLVEEGAQTQDYIRSKMMNTAHGIVGRPYKHDLSDFLITTFTPRSVMLMFAAEESLSRLHRVQRSLERCCTTGNAETDSLPAITKAAAARRLTTIPFEIDAFESVKNAHAARQPFGHIPTNKTLFCSELIAACYKASGALNEAFQVNAFSPVDFIPRTYPTFTRNLRPQRHIPLSADYAFGPLQLLKRDPHADPSQSKLQEVGFTDRPLLQQALRDHGVEPAAATVLSNSFQPRYVQQGECINTSGVSETGEQLVVAAHNVSLILSHTDAQSGRGLPSALRRVTRRSIHGLSFLFKSSQCDHHSIDGKDKQTRTSLMYAETDGYVWQATVSELKKALDGMAVSDKIPKQKIDGTTIRQQRGDTITERNPVIYRILSGSVEDMATGRTLSAGTETGMNGLVATLPTDDTFGGWPSLEAASVYLPPHRLRVLSQEAVLQPVPFEALLNQTENSAQRETMRLRQHYSIFASFCTPRVRTPTASPFWESFSSLFYKQGDTLGRSADDCLRLDWKGLEKYYGISHKNDKVAQRDYAKTALVREFFQPSLSRGGATFEDVYRFDHLIEQVVKHSSGSKVYQKKDKKQQLHSAIVELLVEAVRDVEDINKFIFVNFGSDYQISGPQTGIFDIPATLANTIVQLSRDISVFPEPLTHSVSVNNDSQQHWAKLSVEENLAQQTGFYNVHETERVWGVDAAQRGKNIAALGFATSATNMLLFRSHLLQWNLQITGTPMRCPALMAPHSARMPFLLRPVVGGSLHGLMICCGAASLSTDAQTISMFLATGLAATVLTHPLELLTLQEVERGVSAPRHLLRQGPRGMFRGLPLSLITASSYLGIAHWILPHDFLVPLFTSPHYHHALLDVSATPAERVRGHDRWLCWHAPQILAWKILLMTSVTSLHVGLTYPLDTIRRTSIVRCANAPQIIRELWKESSSSAPAFVRRLYRGAGRALMTAASFNVLSFGILGLMLPSL